LEIIGVAGLRFILWPSEFNSDGDSAHFSIKTQSNQHAMIGPANAANIHVNVSDASQLVFGVSQVHASIRCQLKRQAMGRGFRFDIGDYTTPQQITWVGPW